MSWNFTRKTQVHHVQLSGIDAWWQWPIKEVSGACPHAFEWIEEIGVLLLFFFFLMGKSYFIIGINWAIDSIMLSKSFSSSSSYWNPTPILTVMKEVSNTLYNDTSKTAMSVNTLFLFLLLVDKSVEEILNECKIQKLPFSRQPAIKSFGY